MRDYHWFLLKPNVPVCYVLLRTVCRKKQKKTELLHFLPLQSGADSWADYILQLLPYERRTHKEEIEKAHFSIEYTAKEMKDIFI